MMRRTRRAMQLVITLIALVLSMEGAAQAATRIIAVLPLDVRHAKGKLGTAERLSLEDMLRDVAADALTPVGWTILTGEATLQVLRDNGIDPAKCTETNCHLEMARVIKAEKFLTGSVQQVEGVLTASIRLVETSGKIIATERMEAKTVILLRRLFSERAETFFERGGIMTARQSDAVIQSYEQS